jgi:hypothetical protein
MGLPAPLPPLLDPSAVCLLHRAAPSRAAPTLRQHPTFPRPPAFRCQCPPTATPPADDNELLTLEVVHQFVEVLDKYFGNVCELDLIFNFHKVCVGCA